MSRIALYRQEISYKDWKFLKTENRILVTEIEFLKMENSGTFMTLSENRMLVTEIEFLKMEKSGNFMARSWFFALHYFQGW